MNPIVQRAVAVLTAIVAVSAVHVLLPPDEAKPLTELIAALAAGWVPSQKKEN